MHSRARDLTYGVRRPGGALLYVDLDITKRRRAGALQS
jgi:hypothetical protein